VSLGCIVRPLPELPVRGGHPSGCTAAMLSAAPVTRALVSLRCFPQYLHYLAAKAQRYILFAFLKPEFKLS
jgi:hypothetical protein